MGAYLDIFSGLNQAFYFSFGEVGFLDKTQKIHDIRLFMKVIDNLWIGRR